jgi:drug/metabolite transporter (DMT)-like permease
MDNTMIGALFAVLAATSWASGAIFARIGMQHMGSTTGTFFSLITGFFAILLIALITDYNGLFNVTGAIIPWFILLAFIQFPLGRFLNFNGIKLAGVAPATAILGSTPVFSAVFALIFLGEVITPLIGIGILCVVGGLAIVLYEKKV